jgi:hypothetical protein
VVLFPAAIPFDLQSKAKGLHLQKGQKALMLIVH